MKKLKVKLTSIIVALFCITAPAILFAQAEEDKHGYVSVNGLEMYYEIHGTGQPLVVLHGAMMTIGGMGKLVPSFARTRQVIAVEMQGHGHTADIDRPLSYKQMADDVVALMREIGIKEADIFGFSMGGGVALQVAIRHPEVVRKLVVVSAPYNIDGMYPGLLTRIQNSKLQAFAQSPVGSQLVEAYQKVAPNPDEWRNLFRKTKKLALKGKNLTAEDIQSIKAPTLVIIGDADDVRPEHAVQMFQLLGGGGYGDPDSGLKARLAILPGTSHMEIINRRTEWVVSMTTEFLNAPMPQSP